MGSGHHHAPPRRGGDAAGSGLERALELSVAQVREVRARVASSEGAEHLAIIDVHRAMLRDPSHWRKHYHGTPQEQARARLYSRSDRVRYYWPDPQVQAALKKLMANLARAPLPLDLLSRHVPRQFERLRSGALENTPGAIVEDAIQVVLEDYDFACEGRE